MAVTSVIQKDLPPLFDREDEKDESKQQATFLANEPTIISKEMFDKSPIDGGLGRRISEIPIKSHELDEFQRGRSRSKITDMPRMTRAHSADSARTSSNGNGSNPELNHKRDQYASTMDIYKKYAKTLTHRTNVIRRNSKKQKEKRNREKSRKRDSRSKSRKRDSVNSTTSVTSTNSLDAIAIDIKTNKKPAKKRDSKELDEDELDQARTDNNNNNNDNKNNDRGDNDGTGQNNKLQNYKNSQENSEIILDNNKDQTGESSSDSKESNEKSEDRVDIDNNNDKNDKDDKEVGSKASSNIVKQEDMEVNIVETNVEEKEEEKSGVGMATILFGVGCVVVLGYIGYKYFIKDGMDRNMRVVRRSIKFNK